MQPGSVAARAGLEKGGIVIGIGQQRISSLTMLRSLAVVRPRQRVLVVADTRGNTRYMVIN